MTKLFDGIETLAGAVFGGSVTVHPSGGSGVVVQAIFRSEPVRTVDSEGFEVLIVAPTLRIPVGVAPTLRNGDLVQPGNGKSYRIVNTHPTGSPAVDAGLIHELEEIST